MVPSEDFILQSVVSSVVILGVEVGMTRCHDIPNHSTKAESVYHGTEKMDYGSPSLDYGSVAVDYGSAEMLLQYSHPLYLRQKIFHPFLLLLLLPLGKLVECITFHWLQRIDERLHIIQ